VRLLTSLPSYPRITRLPLMRFAFFSFHSLIRIRLTSLPSYPRVARLPLMRFAFFSFHSLIRIRLTSLPSHPRTIRLPRMSSIRPESRSRVGQAKIQQEPTRYETDDFGRGRYHESLLG
jgi:hypothetical protein